MELQEVQKHNSQLTMELHSLHENNHAEKEILHERIRHAEKQMHHLKSELDQKQDVVRQLEVKFINIINSFHFK